MPSRLTLRLVLTASIAFVHAAPYDDLFRKSLDAASEDIPIPRLYVRQGTSSSSADPGTAGFIALITVLSAITIALVLVLLFCIRRHRRLSQTRASEQMVQATVSPASSRPMPIGPSGHLTYTGQATPINGTGVQAQSSPSVIVIARDESRGRTVQPLTRTHTESDFDLSEIPLSIATPAPSDDGFSRPGTSMLHHMDDASGSHVATVGASTVGTSDKRSSTAASRRRSLVYQVQTLQPLPSA